MLLEEYISPFQDVSDINFVKNNEYLYFDCFDSLDFPTANANLPSCNKSSLDEIDDLINNQIESIIHQCKYYDSQTFENISKCNRFSLLFTNINSFITNFDAYLLSYFSTSGFMPKIYIFFVKRSVHLDLSSYTRYVNTNRCSEAKLLQAVALLCL